MNATKQRIKDIYFDMTLSIDTLRKDPSQENLDELKIALDKMYEGDAKCAGIIYTCNLDKLFFGLYVLPKINADDVIDTITSDKKLLIKEYYLELDSRLFGLDLGLTTEEILAIIIHDVGAIVGDSSPCETVKRAIDKYLKDNHEVLKLSDSIHYKEIISFGFRDAIRKYTTLFEKSKYKKENSLIDEFLDFTHLEDNIQSAFDKIDRMGFNFNREVDNKFLTLSWVMRIYKDIANNRIPAIKILQKCQELTPSQIEKKELNNMFRRINRIDDDALLESYEVYEMKALIESKSLYRKLSLPFEKCCDKCDDIEIKINNTDQEPDAIPDLIHTVNNQLTMIDDYMNDNPEMKNEYKGQWKKMFKKMAGFRKHLEKKSTSLFTPQIKMHNTWKAQSDV